MRNTRSLSFLLIFLVCSLTKLYSQTVIESYKPISNDSLRIGHGENDFLPFIESGYTLMLPEGESIKGVLIFLEDSKFDQRNQSAKQMYSMASKREYAVLSVSTNIPLDFYFSESSIKSTHQLIQNVFNQYRLPIQNVFFLGASLTGHRALKYIEFADRQSFDFKLNVKGIVVCNFTMDWTRKWYQHKRDIRIGRIDLSEPRFINYMLEKHLQGTPETAKKRYHQFSTYSYFDEENRNIEIYKDYHIRAYIETAIEYRLKKYYHTLYENNTTDIVGFLAELKLIGNDKTELINLESSEKIIENHSSQGSWDSIDKYELMDWILNVNYSKN